MSISQVEYILLMAQHWGGNIASSLGKCVVITIRHFLPSLSSAWIIERVVELPLEAGWGHHIIKPFSDKSLGKFAVSSQSASTLPSLQTSVSRAALDSNI